ncbi:helix-turn-helix transcriptional regulator [Alishewanella sp. HL-SH06]|uniref:helix-turn-helix transcriptional regulator n=1 Tax=Alishewanella sp. HL-SH06 TaxID=3461144 RepID=UPI0040429F78
MQLIRLPEVLKMVPVGKTTWYSMVNRNEAPAPISLGARAVAWDREEIESWIRAKKAGNNDQRDRSSTKQ